ncbi:transcription factor bhlh93 [Phtheirospermum japonicum]|uniref:Transcription factor bhlh93 n=1 Tax=Phtheirospermum japonicum TaxID=374723 RepID=A0A830C5L7_9LAMI|nr:transcription factor bhlh93 [Phtheirospermum japonicum]
MDIGAPCKMEPLPEMPGAYNLGFGPQMVSERKSKAKKVSGQPSKNLMAERRRRKRLNDRLSMLRSVVPKISKMDRTSILGDTIDYMKELIERINGLQKEMHLGSNQLSAMSIFNDVKPNEIVVRNSPKFDVERRNADTRIEICCGAKQGLLLSTVTTLEALGLEIQQCVISCFNEFSLQASCSEELKKRTVLDSEDIRQALLRNAGYGEKCL